MAGKIRPCVHCGSLFRPEFPKGAARTCSDECAKARRRVTHNAAAKTYYAKNAEEITAKVREREKANPEKKRETWNRWMRRHREQWNAYNRARYAKGRGNGA
jgi:hypothetical protein